MTKPQFILGCGPEQDADVRALGCTAAHLCYRVSASGKLMRTCPRAVRGGIMSLCLDADSAPDTENFARSVGIELRMSGAEGLFADADVYSPKIAALIPKLEALCARMHRDLYVTEKYALDAQNAYVLIGSDVAAGSYTAMIAEQAQRLGNRFALELVPLSMDFLLPSGGNGRQISAEELDMLLARGLTPYYADALCAHYVTYRDSSGSTHFTVFDDASTLRRKWETAAQYGAGKIFGLYDELAEALPDILP